MNAPARWRLHAAACLLLAGAGWGTGGGRAAEGGSDYFSIHVVDQATGRGVPCVRLALSGTTGLVYTSDSAGRIAIREPGLLGLHAHFAVLGDGYVRDAKHPRQNGVAIRLVPGKKETLFLHRTLAAQRLYRSTGLDPYWQSRRLRLAPPHTPPLRAKIIGQDSAYVTRYRNQLFWTWGDTIGVGPRTEWNYEATAAVSRLPEQGGQNPADGVDLQYFVDEARFAKPMVAPEDGGALTWLDGLTTLTDQQGDERLFALYVQMRRVAKHRPLKEGEARHLTGFWWTDDALAREVELKRRREIGRAAVEQYLEETQKADALETRVTRGLMEYRPETEYFHRVATFPAREIDELQIGSHAVLHPPEQATHVVFSGLAPNRRVVAGVDAIADIARYESFTCLREGVRVPLDKFHVSTRQLDRDASGRLRYAWRRDTSPIGPREQAKLVEAGRIDPEERWLVLCDVRTGKELINQHHSLQWNPYRRRYAGLFTCQLFDESQRASEYDVDSLNQLWYGEADTLLGPWAYLEKVVDVGDYAYYNPLYNPYFHQQGGRIIYFEGTYTRFMNVLAPMRARDNYNQVMHRLDLNDPRVTMPVAVYSITASDRRYVTHHDVPPSYAGVRQVCFFAPDRPRPDCVPIYETVDDGTPHLTAGASDLHAEEVSRIAFYALPVDAPQQRAATTPLYQVRNRAGQTIYFAGSPLPQGFERLGGPICRVWPRTSRFNPYKPAIDLQGQE